jgi:amino acid permease
MDVHAAVVFWTMALFAFGVCLAYGRARRDLSPLLQRLTDRYAMRLAVWGVICLFVGFWFFLK